MKLLLPILIVFHFLSILAINATDEEVEGISKNLGTKRRLKVLVYSPSISWSHMKFLGTIADILVEQGHEVHFVKLLKDPFLATKNETKFAHKVHRIQPKYSTIDELNLGKIDSVAEPFSGKGFYTLKALNRDFAVEMKKIFERKCKEILWNKPLLEELKSHQFDVAITEIFDMCPYAMFHAIGVRTKLAAMALPWLHVSARRFGIPTFSSYVPTNGAPINAPKMSFWERAINFYNDFYEWSYEYGQNDQMTEVLIREAFGPDFPSISELTKNISLYFLNNDPFLEFARPISSKVISIGGLVETKAGKLDQKMKSLLDGAKEGAVLVSFGSVADSRKMSLQMVSGMLAAFSRFPKIQFIMKLDEVWQQNQTALFSAAPNVHAFDWVEQAAILEHPNLRAFVTHAGQNSLTEAAKAGIPIVVIPLFADQFYNAVLAKHKGMALFVDVRQLNGQNGQEVMFNALNEVLTNPSFKSKAKLLGRKLSLSPFSAKEKLIKWVEFAAEFDELQELNLPTDYDMHWFVYYSLDVILFTAIILLALTLLVTVPIFIVWRRIVLAFSNISRSIESGMKKNN